jgi:hypothetical protein
MDVSVWTAIGAVGTAVGAIATGVLVLVGSRQIKTGWDQLKTQMETLRSENKIERTLTACSRYESDVTIERCAGTLRLAHNSETYEKDPKQYQHEVIIVLNYLDTIAIGIEQQL